MQIGRLLGLAADLLVPVSQNRRQPLPGVRQCPHRQFGSQMVRKNVTDLVNGHVEPVMQPTGQTNTKGRIAI